MDKLLALGEKAGALLKARKETVTVAESSTGGLVAAALLAVPGASAYFLGGAVVYTRQARTTLLGVPVEALKAAAPASEQMAMLLAEGAKARMHTTWGLGEAGATGPTGNSYGHAAGHGVFAVTGPVASSRTIETGSPDRYANMLAFSETLLEMFVAALDQAK